VSDEYDDIGIAAEVVAETDKAWLLSDGAKEAWVPKSLVEREGAVFQMPEWLAMDKGFI
jgi:RNase P/RNase MRP subunit p29